MLHLTPILFSLLGLVVSVSFYLYNVYNLIYIQTSEFIRFAANYRNIIIIGLILFTLGLPFLIAARQSMTATSITWECGIIKATQVSLSVVGLPIHDIWVWVTIRWNDIVLYIRSCFVQLIDDIKAIQDIASLTGVTDLITSVTEAIFNILSFMTEVNSIKIPYYTDFLSVVQDNALGILREIVKLIISIVKVTIFSEDCDLCDLAPGLPSTCSILTYAGPDVVIDCSSENCHSYICTIISKGLAVPKFIFGLVPNLGSNSFFDDLEDALCCFTSLWKRPFFVVVGLIDDATNNNGCVTADDIIDHFVDWIIELLGCIDSFFQAITAGKINSFFEFIYQWLFNAAYIVTQGVKDIITCFQTNEQTQCLSDYPGSCAMSGYEAISGLQTCNEILEVCLADIPLLDPIFNIGGVFNLTTITTGILIAVDSVICPVTLSIGCMAGIEECVDANAGNPFVRTIGCTREGLFCIQEDVPPFSPLAGALSNTLDFIDDGVTAVEGVISEIQTTIFGIINGFRCMGAECVGEGFTPIFDGPGGDCSIKEAVECMVACFDDYTACDGDKTGKRKRQEEGFNYTIEYGRSMWIDYLIRNNITNETTCGSILYKRMPSEVTLENSSMGDYYFYTGCLFMYGFGHITREKYGSEVVVDHFLDSKNMSSALNTTFSYIDIFNSPHETDVIANYQTTTGQKRSISSLIFNSTTTTKERRHRRVPYNEVTLKRKEFVNKNTRWLLSKLWERFKVTKYYHIVSDLHTSVDTIAHKYGVDKRARTMSPMLLPYQDAKVITDMTVPKSAISEHKLANMNVEFMEKYLNFSNEFMKTYRRDMAEWKMRERTTKRKYIKDSSDKTKRGESNMFESRTPYDLSASVYFDYHFMNRMMKKYYHRDLTLFDMVQRNMEMREEVKRFSSIKSRYNIDQKVKTLQAVVQVLDSRYGIKEWPSVHTLYMLSDVMIYNRTIGNLDKMVGWMYNKYGYIPGQGFVNYTEYEEHTQRNTRYIRGSVLDQAAGTFNVRDPMKLGPFLIDFNYTNIFPDIEDLIDLLKTVGEQEQQQTGNVGVIYEDFDFNQIVADIADFSVSIVFDTGNAFSNGYKSMITRIETFDYEEFFMNDTGIFITELLTCTIPENIDNTYMYNPLCFPLIPEGFLNFLTPIPTKYFPLQVPYPEELISVPCVNVYNGKPRPPWGFELSDNCKEVQGNNSRPFCPVCDYCHQEFTTCKEATGKFSDGLDSILFILASLPRAGDSYLVDGFSVRAVFYVSLCVIVLVTLLFAPVTLFPAVWVLQLVFWAISLRNSVISFGALVLIVTVIIAVIAPSAIVSSPMAFLVAGIASIIWTISVFFPFSLANQINIISGMKTIVIYMNESVLFTILPQILFYIIVVVLLYVIIFSTFQDTSIWFRFATVFVLISAATISFSFQLIPLRLPDLNPLVRRLDRFDYQSNEAIPYVDKFCMVISFSHTGYAILVSPFLFKWFIPLAWNITVLSGSFSIELILIILGYRTAQTIARVKAFTDNAKGVYQKAKNFNLSQQVSKRFGGRIENNTPIQLHADF